MQQLCLPSRPPVLISRILLLYRLQAPFGLGVCVPAPRFAQSTRQARQLDLLHVLQGFVLGVLQEISLALRMHRQTCGRESGVTHNTQDRRQQYCSCVSALLLSQVLSQIPSFHQECQSLGRDQSSFCTPTPSSLSKAAASTVGRVSRTRSLW